MALQIFPDMPGIKVGANSLSIDYNVIGAPVSGDPSADYRFVRAAVLDYVPKSNAPPGVSYAWPRRAFELKEAGWGVWKATVQWAALSVQYALKIGGSQQQIRADKSVVHAYAGSIAVPDALTAGTNGAAVGFDGRTIHGASIYVPTRSWTESVEIPISDYTFDYEDQVGFISQSPVNEAEFRGWHAGDVIFHGMQSQLSTQNPDFVTAVFEFEMSPGNRSGTGQLPLLSVGGITGIEKDGWDYLDVKWNPALDSTSPTTIMKAEYALVHRLLDRSDFTPLNIGTSESLPIWQGPIQG